MLIVVIYICTGVSCCVFYLREHRSEFNLFLHLLIPLAASLLFIPVLLAAFGVDFAGLGIEPLASPASFAPYLIVVLMLLGVLVLAYFARSDPERIKATRKIFDEEGKPGPVSRSPRAG